MVAPETVDRNHSNVLCVPGRDNLSVGIGMGSGFFQTSFLEGGNDRSGGPTFDPRFTGEPFLPEARVNFFQGKSRGYTIERYVVTDPNRRDLTEIAIAVSLFTYPNRDKELLTERVIQGLSHPRTVLQIARYEGNPVGTAVLRKITFNVGAPARRKRVGYSSRAIVEEHEGEWLGTMFLEEGVKAQDEDVNPIDAIALMTQNVQSFLTLRRAKRRLDFEGSIRPFERLYRGRTPEDLLLSVHKEVRLASDEIRLWNGVSVGELKELGSNERIYRPERGTEAAHYDDLMVKTWGVNKGRGDVVYLITPREEIDAGDESTAVVLPKAA